MDKKDGEYYYAPHRRFWGIWQNRIQPNNTAVGMFIKDCNSKQEAREEVFRLNGWKK